MAIITAGGRECYVDAIPLSLTTSYISVKSRCKGILHKSTGATVYKFPSGTEVTITAAADQIVPFAPSEIKLNSGTATFYALY
jgi:hypothetical protein